MITKYFVFQVFVAKFRKEIVALFSPTEQFDKHSLRYTPVGVFDTLKQAESWIKIMPPPGKDFTMYVVYQAHIGEEGEEEIGEDVSPIWYFFGAGGGWKIDKHEDSRIPVEFSTELHEVAIPFIFSRASKMF